ncbi:MAG: hypothetical protein JWR61_1191 [Ferruginibacter sp.]|uniref:outer membrane beta-barrel protein n=1 Tax=Ferruginibacter sp. TaxID=1940288 RepID=UPI002658E551|nr:outer membrane beta-barrel protein [Ferruginibacter sp.]MDB5276236.1 hypothetical protein [Ferruginibacter sp.]
MQKTILSVLTIIIFSKAVSGQVTKGSWLVSGSANYSRLQSSSEAATKFKQTNFQISPTVGYFLKDKFALGLRPSLSYGSNTIANSNTVLGIGPFSRYYFLKPENIFNLFTEGSYSYGTITGGQRLNTFSILAGQVVYFNSSVGLEFTVGYSTTKIVDYSGTNNEIKVGIGFQFHLEEDR